MLAEAKAADAHYGPALRGDELPEGLGGRRERRKRVKEAKERLQREAEAAAKAVQEHVGLGQGTMDLREAHGLSGGRQAAGATGRADLS